MDNRRVIRSYREKQAASSSATPYARPGSSGLLSKVKQFFSPAALWQKDDQQSKEPENRSFNQATPSFNSVPSSQDESRAISPFKFPEPELKTPLKATSLSSDPSKTPNHVLTSFFQTKGDRPLTEIEYEGVVALLSKSRQATPATVKKHQQPQDLLPSHTPSQKRTHSQAQDDINIGNGANSANTSQLFATPYTQKVLKNNSAIFATPEYKPIYHTVNDNSFSQTRGQSSIPSVKRVYHFSGLPSPYRTRIRTPNVSTRRKTDHIANSIPNGSINTSLSNSTTFNNSTTTNTVSTNKKPLSNAANALLSILDGGEESNESNIKAFSSPFTKPKKAQKDAAVHESTPKKTGMTPADIAKTISFDQSKKLPEIEQPLAEAKKEEHKIQSEVPIKNGSDASSAAKFSFQPSVAKTATAPFASTSSPEAPSKSLPRSVVNAPASTKPSVGSTSNSLFGSTAAATPAQSFTAANGSNGSTKPAFSFGATKKPTTDTNPVAASSFGSNTIQPKVDAPSFQPQAPASSAAVSNSVAPLSYNFPEIKQDRVQLDQGKVESYKALFNF